MSTLILDQSNLELSNESAALVIHQDGIRKTTIPIKLIDRCVIQGASIKIETGLLQKLAEAGASVMLLSPRYSKRVALILGPKHNDARIRLAQTKQAMNPAWCDTWSLEIVTKKTKRQLKAANQLMENRHDIKHALLKTQKSLQEHLVKLEQLNNSESVSLSTLRGVEGSATRIWFSAYCQAFPASLGFNGRNRRPPKDPVNAVLSFCYTLMHFEAVRAAHTAGLDPLIGFYHQPAFGRESLASDLIEPLRPAIDLMVLELFSKKVLRNEHFSLHENACLMSKTARSHVYLEWKSFLPVYSRWLRTICRQTVNNLIHSTSIDLIDNGDNGDEEF